MKLSCVLFCLENNSYISKSFFDENGDWIGSVEYDRDYKDALHFANRQEAIEFLDLFEKEIIETSGFSHFTPREYFILK